MWVGVRGGNGRRVTNSIFLFPESVVLQPLLSRDPVQAPRKLAFPMLTSALPSLKQQALREFEKLTGE